MPRFSRKQREIYMAYSALIIAAAIILAGCVQTNYKAVDYAQTPENSPLARQVLFHVDREFYRDPPNCVVVLPTLGFQNQRLAKEITRTFGQRLTGHVPRVILPLERQRISISQAYNFSVQNDLRRFSARERCGFYARAMNGAASEAFMLLWSEKQVGFTLSLARISDNKTLWWASHTARRGDGGIPLSPMSAINSSAMAGKFYRDDEVIASLMDDAQRRMMQTFPDVR